MIIETVLSANAVEVGACERRCAYACGCTCARVSVGCRDTCVMLGLERLHSNKPGVKVLQEWKLYVLSVPRTYYIK